MSNYIIEFRNKIRKLLSQESVLTMELNEYTIKLQEFHDISHVQDDAAEENLENQAFIVDIRSQKKYQILNYPLFIGREKTSSICVPMSEVSRRHAKVFPRDGAYFVQDLGSINGTYLNDQRIIDPVQLKNGDKIKVAITQKVPNGAKEFLFRIGLSEEEKKAQAALAERAERDALIKEMDLLKGSPNEKKLIALRHCTCSLMKRDLLSTFFKADEAQRVPLKVLDLANKIVQFYTFIPYKVKDSLLLEIKNPKLADSIKIYIRIIGIELMPMYRIVCNKAEIIKISEQDTKILQNSIDTGELIDYITNTLIQSPNEKEKN